MGNGQTYYARVAAQNDVGEGSSAGPVSATPTAPGEEPLEEPDRAPGPPTGLTLTAGDGRIAAAWTAPSDPGKPALTGYVLRYRQQGQGEDDWQYQEHNSTATQATIPNLTNGTEYEVHVAAVNTIGESRYTGIERATLQAPEEGERAPGVPRNLTLTPGDQQIEASWDAPADPGEPELQGYSVQYCQGESGDWTDWPHSGAGATAAITGLNNGTEHQVRVAATNSVGTGEYAQASATPEAPPDWRIPSILVINPQPNSGEYFSLGVRATNAGGAEAPATTLRWYRSDDVNITPDDHQISSRAVAKTASGVARVISSGPVEAGSGTYYYGACLDPVAGEDGNNNCSEAITVTVP